MWALRQVLILTKRSGRMKPIYQELLEMEYMKMTYENIEMDNIYGYE